MTFEEIIKSGLVERFVLGQCSQEEETTMVSYLEQYPILVDEIESIAKSLGNYAKSQGIAPSKSVKDKILHQIRGAESKPNESVKRKGYSIASVLLSGLLTIALLSCLYFWNKQKSTAESFSNYKESCDSIVNQQEQEIRQFRTLTSAGNQLFAFESTAAYSRANLQLCVNPNEKKVFLLVSQIPEIESNQSFQLWSLKDGQDPIPMNLFKVKNEFLLPLDYEEDTATFAITIEDEAGASSPNLDKLIGTFSRT